MLICEKFWISDFVKMCIKYNFVLIFKLCIHSTGKYLLEIKTPMFLFL